MAGCVGHSRWFGSIFSPGFWLHCKRLLVLSAPDGCLSWPVCPLPRSLRGHSEQGSTGQRLLCSGREYKEDAGCLVPAALWATAGFGRRICSRSGRRRERDEDIPEHLELRDRFGNTLYFLNAGDVLLAPTTIIPDARERLTEIKQLELRQDDVIIAGFMKSGNHWVQQIVRMLLQGNTNYKPNTLSFEVFEYIPQHLMTPPDEPRAFFTHLRFHHLPTQVLEKKVKIIHLVRNPKDTFVSMFLHLSKMKGMMRYTGTWDQFFMTMLEFGVYHGDWFDHLFDWEQEIASHPKAPVMVLPYEDLLREPLGHVQKANAFIGADRSEDLCRAIVESCKLDTMKQKEEDLLRKLDVCTKDSQGFYRKGQIGDWKNWFTPAQNRIFDQVYTRRMAHSKRTFTFE